MKHGYILPQDSLLLEAERPLLPTWGRAHPQGALQVGGLQDECGISFRQVNPPLAFWKKTIICTLKQIKGTMR